MRAPPINLGQRFLGEGRYGNRARLHEGKQGIARKDVAKFKLKWMKIVLTMLSVSLKFQLKASKF